MMNEYYLKLKAELYAASDEQYNEFNAKIVNSEQRTIGVRIPLIRKLAKSVPADKRNDVMNGFFADPDKTYEE